MWKVANSTYPLEKFITTSESTAQVFECNFARDPCLSSCLGLLDEKINLFCLSNLKLAMFLLFVHTGKRENILYTNHDTIINCIFYSVL